MGAYHSDSAIAAKGTVMNIIDVNLNLGAKEPFTIWHISDSHLCLADGRDNERKNKLAASRANEFTGGHPERLTAYAEEQFAAVRESGAPLIYTGDFCDFVSEANLDYAKRLFSTVDSFVCAGNHEFSQYVGEAWEDEDYKAMSFEKVCAAFPANNIWYSERMIGGIRFVAVDNNYYYVLPEQIERFRAALSDGVPVVLCVHNPLYSENTYELVMKNKAPDEPPYLCGCPYELLLNLNDHRRRQQTTNELTREFVDLCESSKNLKAILAGHLHRFVSCAMNSGIPQIVAPGGYANEVVRYTVR
ncbi:MAG: hypothetical protein E7576_13155 [Ruminococcaceae bacterium]|jgi:hypothetical protein|nr:hypothetical protein [Oscillospiraceae bacterium]